MTLLRLTTASVVVCLIAACSSSGTTGPQTGTIAGTVSSSLGGVLANITVTVTPTGKPALPAVQTAGTGSYSVSSVPIGSGYVAVSGLPANCTVPAQAPYLSLTRNETQTVNITVTCTQPPGGLSGTVTSSATNAGKVAFGEREIRPTLAHESKHIVSIGEHLVNAPFLEQVWLEEGLAQPPRRWKGDADSPRRSGAR